MTAPPVSAAPDLSVIVCTYNRCRVLDRMLASYYAQPDIETASQELVLVDNNSSDQTRTVAAIYEDRQGFRYVREPEQGLSAARNRGVAEARGSILAFLDDDVLVDGSWCRSLQSCFRVTGATVVGGRARLLFEAETPDWFGPFFRTLLSEVDFGDERRQIRDGVGLWGVNLAFNGAALRSVGGFDPKLGRRGGELMGGEEMAVIDRMLEMHPGTAYYDPDASVQHLVGASRLEWDYFKRLARANGMTQHAREPWQGRVWQTARVLRASLAVATVWLRMVFDRAGGYHRRYLAWQLLRATSYLTCRWRSLKSANPKMPPPHNGGA